MKKYGKFIVLAVATFLSSILPCFAKQMTIDGLETELEEKVPDAGYVYIIGEYAFTSEHTIDLTDIVLASDSINNKGDKTDKTQVNIYQLIRKYDGDYNAIGLEETTNVIGTGKLPQTFDIRYIDYIHIGETTETKVEFDIDKTTYSTYQDVLEEKLGFETSEFYSGKLTNENGKIKGILLKKSAEDVSLNDDDKIKYANAQYFLAYIIEVPDATNETTIKKTGFDGTTVDIPLSAFDVPVGSKDKTPGIVILTPIDLEKIKENKKIVYTIDLDGEKDLYDPYEYVIDLSEVTFQTDSSEKASIIDNNKDIVSETDKKTFEKWNYNSDNVTLTKDESDPLTYHVSGKLIEQTLANEAFGEDEATGYFFDFTFILEGNESHKATVSQLADKESGGVFKEVQESEFDEKGNLTTLIRIDPSKGCSNADNCKVYYKVDLDGNGDEYLPVIYTIDFSKVTREKASLFTVDGITEKAGKFSNDNWFTEDYSLSIAEDGSSAKLFKATGLLPLVKVSWSPEENSFKDNNYYMGLAIQLTNAPESYDGTGLEVKLNDENIPFIQKYDNKTIYLLVGLTKDSSTKEFTITLDLDGGSEEYAPYDVTVDYTGVSFQSITEINSTFGKLDEADLEDGTPDGTPAKAELDSYGFNFETIDELGISYDYGISGNLKEQTLLDTAGFKNNQGYFAPIKINVQMPEGFEKYKNKWTITLYDEEENKRIVKPKDNEYEQGWLLVLFRFDEDKFALKVDNLHYEIDLDGNEKNYLPQEFTIPVNSCKFLKARKVKFNYFDEKNGKATSETITAYQGEKIPETKIPSFSGYSYHEFIGWYNEGETIADLSSHYVQDRDEKYTAHFTINTDKFIEDKVTSISGDGNYTDILDISKSGNDITLKVLNQKTEISTLKSILEENISYIFSRNEITKITLTIDEESPIVITYKDTVGNKLNDLFNGKSLLYNMATKTLTINVDTETLSKSVQIAEGKETFTIHFVSDVVGVHNETELGTALSSNEVSHIQILQDFFVSKAYDVLRDVVITGLHEGGNYTITADSEVTNIFNVTSGNVTIESVKLKDATNEAILLNGGTLTTKDVAIEYTDEALPETVEAGIKVEAGTLTATNMTFAKEHYNTPLVKAKTGSIVNLTDKDNLQAVAKDKAEITNTPNGNDTKKDIIDEYKNYHNDSHNAKIYTTELMTHEGGARLHFLKYNYYNESVKPITEVSQFESFTSEGKKFTMYGYTKVSYQNLYEKATVEENAAKDGVIKANDLKATSDEGYWVVYTVEEAPNAASVTDKDTLLAALSNSEKTSVYIPDSTTIDMQGANLEINHDIAIYTKSSNPATIINIGKITISASDVSFNRINLEVKASKDQDSLIEVIGKKFSFWQGGLKNTGNEVDYAIKYDNAESVVDIRYMGIGGSKGFDGNKIKEAYIYVDGKITDGSDLYLNTFAAGPKGVIKINGFEGANKEDDIYGIRFLSNTVRTTEYAMKLASSVSGQIGDIRFGKGKIIVEYTDSLKDFGNIDLLVDKQEDPEIYYQKLGGSEEPSKEVPEGGSGIKVSTSVQSSSPIETTISGLSQNEEGTYSGTLTQDEDGKFYLPLVITSSQLQDRKSKVKITDPNENTTEYLYTSSNENGYTTIANIANSWPLKAISSIQAISEAVPQNNGTMKINLEALKASKAKEGKVYTIAFDYDGDGSYDEPQTIDYSEVKTEEEIILDAAKNTQDAKSLTVTKNNKINGLEEDFSYQYDTEKDVTLYSENNEDKEYTFRYNKVDTTHNGDIIIAVRKFVEADTNTCKNDVCVPTINGWTFANFFKKVSRGYHELSLLQDLIKKDNEVVDAISKVSKVQNQEHKYEVTLNQTRLNDWLNNAYLSSEYFDPNQKDNSTSPDEGNTNDNAVVLEVELDENDKYIVSIKTKANFTVTSNEGQKHDDNKIDVKFENPNNTTIKNALEFLGESEGTQATLDEIKEFYEACKKWHTVQTGATIFEE